MIVESLSLNNLAVCLFMLFILLVGLAPCVYYEYNCLLVYASWLLGLFEDSVLDNHSLFDSKWLPCENVLSLKF